MRFCCGRQLKDDSDVSDVSVIFFHYLWSLVVLKCCLVYKQISLPPKIFIHSIFQFVVLYHFRRWLLQRWLNCVRINVNLENKVIVNDYEHSTKLLTVSNSNAVEHSDLRHDMIQHELDICLRTADRYSNNYHAWNHRMWVVEKMACCFNSVSWSNSVVWSLSHQCRNLITWVIVFILITVSTLNLVSD